MRTEEQVVGSSPRQLPIEATSPVIIALDLGTKLGWSTNKGGTITSGTENFAPGRFEGGGMRYLRFRRWISSTISIIEPEEIVFEECRRHIGTDASHAYGAFMGQLTAHCEEHHVPYRGIPVGTIKKHICGRGNANKQAVILAVQKLGFNPADDNEADAIAMLLCALEQAQSGDGPGPSCKTAQSEAKNV